jgi:histidinol-phosphate phosphatase family protein
MTSSDPRHAIFLDRDGVMNELRPDPTTGLLEGPLSVADVNLTDDVVDAIKRLRLGGYFLVGVTNQPAAAKGTISLAEQNAIHSRVTALLNANDASLDDWRICPHHPDGVIAELTMDCDCRKPRPGMLVDAAREHNLDLGLSWIIGDSDSDIEAGIAAGTRTVLIGTKNTHKRQHPERASIQVGTLTEAVDRILALSN